MNRFIRSVRFNAVVLAIPLALLVTCTALAIELSPQSVASREDVIGVVVERWLQGLEAQDPAAMAQFMAQPSVWLHATHPVVMPDQAAFEAEVWRVYGDLLRGPAPQIVLYEVDVVYTGDDALVSGILYIAQPERTPRFLPLTFMLIQTDRGFRIALIRPHLPAW